MERDLWYIRDKYHSKGRRSLELEWHILKVCRGYKRLTIRQLYYILVSRFKYLATKRFYKRVVYHSTKMRRLDPKLNEKFIDPTRQYVLPPLSYPKVEIWCEKDSIRNFISEMAKKYRLSIQVLRGFASLSMYRKAISRAIKRKVGLVLYLGDWDPSGILIEKVAAREMDHKLGITFVRVAITMEQIKRLKPPSRPVNRRDSRAREYIERYGDRCWEIEAIRPRTLYKIIKKGLEENVPPEFLEAKKEEEYAVKIARPVTEALRRTIERETRRMLKLGISEKEILRMLQEKYGVTARKTRREVSSS